MGFIYAVKDNVMAIREDTRDAYPTSEDLISRLSIELRQYSNKKSVEYIPFIPPSQGYYIKDTTCVGSFTDVNNTKTTEMIVITLSGDDSSSSANSESNKTITMEELVKLAKSYDQNLKAVDASEFDGYEFNDARFAEVNPDLAVMGGRPNREQAKPFLTAYNRVLKTEKPSEDSVNPQVSKPQTIFAGFKF